ncbi:FxsA family protein [Falsirhodobacter halotolerans]|uniref:FxsA family protein n=1 Tax=Falsirhodobacter halotolerans TaxID=1146892 RepID=UPI001FD40F43|nr:FxsA family protein [Falsirhodobacter halotolerans]MCJ8140817.1 FxsA family protein [Falsirhodobacter halotolerans]
MWLFALLIALPIIEISLFVTVGAAIGLGPTLLVILATGIGGMALIRAQGGAAQMRRMQEDPMSPLAHKALLVMAGVFLILPGFLTDTLGLLLLLPPVRKLVIARIAKRIRVVMPDAPQRPTTIDGDFVDLDAGEGPTRPTHQPPSAWTRH